MCIRDRAGREDLIGFDKKCLIKPRKMHTDGGWDKKTSMSDKNSNSSYGSGKNAGVSDGGNALDAV